VYERLKHQMAERGVAAQALLIPEIIELSTGDCAMLLELADEFGRFGLGIESFGNGAIAVRETPAILGEVNAKDLILDLLDEISGLGQQPIDPRTDRGDFVPHGLPWLNPIRPPHARRRNERPLARDGGDAPFGPMQPRPPHLCGT
jgi:hypothetical protein